MRISDWSSDVCSSDLDCRLRARVCRRRGAAPAALVRISGAAASHRVLAWRAVPPARTPCARLGGWRVAAQDAVSVSGPQRIVCLTEEPTEGWYGLDQAQRIFGISGFNVRTPQASKETTKVSAFTEATLEETWQLNPDFEIGFYTIQADFQ